MLLREKEFSGWTVHKQITVLGFAQGFFCLTYK